MFIISQQVFFFGMLEAEVKASRQNQNVCGANL